MGDGPLDIALDSSKSVAELGCNVESRTNLIDLIAPEIKIKGVENFFFASNSQARFFAQSSGALLSAATASAAALGPRRTAK